MTKTIAIITEVGCDVCRKATGFVRATNHETGKDIKIEGMQPNTEGWLMLDQKLCVTGVHVCPKCVADLAASKTNPS